MRRILAVLAAMTALFWEALNAWSLIDSVSAGLQAQGAWGVLVAKFFFTPAFPIVLALVALLLAAKDRGEGRPKGKMELLRDGCSDLSAEILSFIDEERKLPESNLLAARTTLWVQTIHSTAHSYRLRFEERVKLTVTKLAEAGYHDQKLSLYVEKPPADIYEIEELGGRLKALCEQIR